MLERYPHITFDGRDFNVKGYAIDGRCRDEGRYYEVESTGSYYATQDCIDEYKVRCGLNFRDEIIPGRYGCLDVDHSWGIGPLRLNVAVLGALDRAWVADGLTQEEIEAIRLLRSVIDSRQNKARLAVSPGEPSAMRIIDMPFLETLEDSDIRALNGLSFATRPLNADYLRVIMSHPALRRGITDELTGTIASLGRVIYGQSPEGRSYTESEVIQMLNSLLDRASAVNTSA